tara:strand:- start:406 stop:570 length:165 start_codon:yes stop_codon:yes gene_type:complete
MNFDQRVYELLSAKVDEGLGQAVANKTSDMEATERVERYTKALKDKKKDSRLPK